VGNESDIAQNALNAVISLLRNVEDTFLKKNCKYTCSFTYIVVEALSMEAGRKDVL
jgi:hypothetical protein